MKNKNQNPNKIESFGIVLGLASLIFSLATSAITLWLDFINFPHLVLVKIFVLIVYMVFITILSVIILKIYFKQFSRKKVQK
jgi:hypothetical protein